MHIKKYSASDSSAISEDHPVKQTQQMLIERNGKKNCSCHLNEVISMFLFFMAQIPAS